ncbi:low molecular weight protein arginine phosphatase [Aureibacillus halotolerans]|uniref:Protein-tyrosine phosphatase n=1 Tax=Aureibacillus halotolerans TaxID=1508390 RepID=A0A4R6U6T1_9BACI|nr:low molecular weight protein arginine phosphatase [Aureibacillus halotolerans]TDQ38744.1 protein-tyrosine phosphatase [Aureibacillus halotolerans]
MKVLFVCTGNTCRSPMAEAIFNAQAPNGMVAKSAGISAAPGAPANQKTAAVLASSGVSINHASAPVSQDVLAWADLILTMEMTHKSVIVMSHPHVADRCFTLKEYVLGLDLWKQLDALKAEQAMQIALGNTPTKHTQQDIETLEQAIQSLGDMDIVDPFGGSSAAYEQTFSEVSDLLDRLFKRLEADDGGS